MERKSPSRESSHDVPIGKVIPFPPRGKTDESGLPKVYTFRIYLIRGPYGEESVGQEIYRTIQVQGDQSLEDLHYAIFCSFGREHDQSYEYCFGKDPYDRSGPRYVCWESRSGSQSSGRRKLRTARLSSLDSLTLEENQIFSYWFGAEEEWMHLVHVLSIEPAEPHEEYPLLIEKVGTPPEPNFSGTARSGAEEEEQCLAQEVVRLLVGEFQMRWRQDVENNPLSPNPGLSAALKRLPAPWLEGVCQKVKRGGSGKRADRIQRLMEHLSCEKSLRDIWRVLPQPSREMLAWVLTEQGGWTTIQRLSRRYGADGDISWWWNEGQEPVTPLGLLRIHGLVYVGRTRIRGRRYKIATVPVELRRHLRKIVQEPEAMADLSPTPAPKGKSGESPVTRKDRRPRTGRDLPDPWQGLDSLSLRSFLSVCPFRKDTEGLYTRMLGRIRRNPREFPRMYLQEFLDRLIRKGSAWSRLAAYKLGFSIYGKRFAEPACRDEARIVRQWARQLLDVRQDDLF